VFFAERMFWSRWRTDDDNVGAFWNLVRVQYRSRNLPDSNPRLSGPGHLADVPPRRTPCWLIEGVFTMTFFGADGIPFP